MKFKFSWLPEKEVTERYISGVRNSFQEVDQMGEMVDGVPLDYAFAALRLSSIISTAASTWCSLIMRGGM